MTGTTFSTMPSCLFCSKQNIRNRCGNCRRVYFCDRDCQRQSWPSHRLVCLLQPERPYTSIQCASIYNTPAVSVDMSLSESMCLDQMEVMDIPMNPVVTMIDEKDQVKLLKTRKKRHKKKKQKARSNSLIVASTSPSVAQELQRKNRSSSLGAKKHIVWGGVSAREFTRFPGGGSAVPYDGTWALGLGKKVADVELGSVQEVEQLREQELQERAKNLSTSKRRDVRVGETRQFDYRRGGLANPLFKRMSENDRKKVFTLAQQVQEEGAMETRLLVSPEMKKSRREYSTASTSSLEDLEELQMVDAVLTTPDFGCLSIEQLEEFVKIRDSRDGACGCSCGNLVKKVAKMNVRKLRAFLQERNVVLPGPGKTELMAAAKKVARKQKNCQSVGSDCECACNGVPCHSDVCEGCAEDCNNPFQRYEYKSTEVTQYRKEQIAKWQHCQVELQQLNEAAAFICVA